MADTEEIKEEINDAEPEGAAKSAFDGIASAVAEGAGKVQEAAMPAVDAVAAKASEAFEAAKPAMSNVASAVAGTAGAVAEAAKPVIDNVASRAGEAYEAAKPKIEEVFGAVAEKASAAFETAKPAVESAASTVKTKAEELLKRDLDGDGKIGDMVVTDVENTAVETGWRTGTNAANDAK